MTERRPSRTGYIAVVEDSKLERTYFEDILRDAGHRVEVFEAAEELLESPNLENYDVVVTDLVMEGMGGLELINKLGNRATPFDIVVVTMRADADTAVRAMRAGAFDYLLKPVNADVLNLTLARCLEKRRLLEQNRRLQRDLELALAGQRLLQSSSTERIVETTLAALQTFVGLEAGLVEAGGTALSIQGLDAAEAEVALGLVRQVGQPSFAQVETKNLLPGLGPTILASTGEGEELLNIFVARGAKSEPIDENDLADANFLLQHAHNALVNERLYARARDEAMRDSLTGLYNARYLEEALTRAMESEAFEDSSISVLFLDIDHFKQVNDTHGHLVGSKLLIELGKVLMRCVREHDLVARFGGDEFVILLDHANAEWAQVVAERIRGAVERRPFLAREGKNLHITVCVGVSCFPDHGSDPRAIFEQADMAMYKGKKADRNAVHLAPQHQAS